METGHGSVNLCLACGARKRRRCDRRRSRTQLAHNTNHPSCKVSSILVRRGVFFTFTAKMNSEITVRKAKREDCKAIRLLIQELADYEKMSSGPKMSHEVLEQDGFDTVPPLFISHVAVCGEEVIGYALSYYSYSTWQGKAMHLEDIFVTFTFRKKHVGTKLLKAVAKEALSNNCCRLDLTVLKWNPAKEFYLHKGATDLTTSEEWHLFRFDHSALTNLVDDF